MSKCNCARGKMLPGNGRGLASVGLRSFNLFLLFRTLEQISRYFKEKASRYFNCNYSEMKPTPSFSHSSRNGTSRQREKGIGTIGMTVLVLGVITLIIAIALTTLAAGNHSIALPVSNGGTTLTVTTTDNRTVTLVPGSVNETLPINNTITITSNSTVTETTTSTVTTASLGNAPTATVTVTSSQTPVTVTETTVSVSVSNSAQTLTITDTQTVTSTVSITSVSTATVTTTTTSTEATTVIGTTTTTTITTTRA
jgi:cytoskeletal protein RodZ